MTRGVGDPLYNTTDPIWEDGTPLEPGYPAGYRTMVSLFASPSYHPDTMIMQVMDNEEYANSPPAIGRKVAATGEWEQAAGPADKVALIDYGDGAGTFIWDTFIPPIVWPPTSNSCFTVRYKSHLTATTADFWWVKMEADYPFTFEAKSLTPDDKGRTGSGSGNEWARLHSLSYNSDASMLVGHHNGSGITPNIHTKFSLWAPDDGAVGYWRSDDAEFSDRYGDGTTGSGTIPQGFIIDKHDHLWIFTHAVVNQSVACWLDEYSWSIGGTDISLTHLNRYQLNNQDGGFNTWSYNIFGATYNEDLDEIVFYWNCAFPSETHTNRDPEAINYGGSGNTPTQYRITHWDLATRSKTLSDADSILITKASDGLLLTDFGLTSEEPGFSGTPGFLGSDMNEDGDRYVGTWTKQDWTCMVSYNDAIANPLAGKHDGFFYIDINTGVATKYADWTEDHLPDDFEGGPDPPGTEGVYSLAGAIYEPTTEKFWAGRRNQGLAGINGPDPENVWYYVTDGFGVYGWDSAPEGVLSGGSGMQLEPIGCIVRAQPYALDVRDLNSVLELGPFRFVEQKESDETSMITTLVLGLTEVDTGLLIEIDLSLASDLSELNQVFGAIVDLDDQVDVLGDDVEIDMGEGVDNSDDFTLELLGNDDGSTYPGPPIEFKPEVLSPIDDRGSTKQYSPTGYSFLYHRVRLKATEIDEKFQVKFVDISGQLTGRLF